MKYIILSSVVFLSGCGNGLMPGNEYCIGGKPITFIGSGHEIVDAPFMGRGGKQMWIGVNAVSLASQGCGL